MTQEIIKYYKGRKFKITMTPIKQTHRDYKEVWFLDELEGDCLNNICNGTKEYCLKTLRDIING